MPLDAPVAVLGWVALPTFRDVGAGVTVNRYRVPRGAPQCGPSLQKPLQSQNLREAVFSLPMRETRVFIGAEEGT